MTHSSHAHDGRWLVLLCVAIATLACTDPAVTYGERAVLRRRAAQAGEGGHGGALVMAGTGALSGMGGLFENPPDFLTPTDRPDATAVDDASAIDDAGELDAEVDAGPPGPEPDPFPYCPAVPFQLVEPTVQGDGEASGCEQLVCPGHITGDNSDLAALSTSFAFYDPEEFRGCTAVVGDVIVHNYFWSDLNALGCLELISGSLIILNAPFLTSLDGLDELQYLQGNLTIAHTAAFDGSVDALTDIGALAKLRTVLGSIAIHAPALRSLAGLEQLQAIGQNLEIDQADSLHDLTGLSGLRAIGGSISLSNASGLVALNGLDALENIGGTLHLDGASALESTTGALPMLSCIMGRIELGGPMPKLRQLDLSASLRRVGADVLIGGNPNLQSISMLRSAQHIRGSIMIQGNELLSELDLSSLERLGGVMIINDNPRLEECPLIELASALDRADASQIYDNARVVSAACPVLGPP